MCICTCALFTLARCHDSSEASDELEEGELLSDMNSDRGDNTGQLPVAPGRYQATPIQAVPIQAAAVPIQAAAVPEKPVVKKPRLRSIASTVQVHCFFYIMPTTLS